jgi:hypothetical protein
MSMYIRLKRKNQTIFLHVEPSNSFGQVKSRVGEIIGSDPTKIMLVASDKVFFIFVIVSIVFIDCLQFVCIVEKGIGRFSNNLRSRN